MKTRHIFATVIFMLVTVFSFAQNKYVGTWKTIDDGTGEAKSYVEIYEQDGKLYGKVTKILNEDRKDAVCEQCKGDKKNQPVQGMILLENLKKKGSYWGGGTITDPENGKSYSCYIELLSDDKLKVRGYIGRAFLGRTQYWYRLN